MWAHLDMDRLDRIVGRQGDVADVVTNLRGSMALDSEVQVAERALFRHYGWDWTTVTIEAAESREVGGALEVDIGWTGHDGDHLARAQLMERRTVRVPVCGAPITSSTSSSVEYSVASLLIDGVSVDRTEPT